MRTLYATRYAVALREGGSLPAIVEASPDGNGSEKFVVKFRGAGQGAKALLAEIIVGQLAAHLGLPVPEIALIDVPEGFGRTERDPEIQDILKGSVGLNVGMAYLDGAFNFNPVSCAEFVSPELAAEIVCLDALCTNIDRTVRNPNLMVVDKKLCLIDHGAALYFHHDWASMDEAKARSAFPMINRHVLLPFAGNLRAADESLNAKLNESVFEGIIDSIPAELLMHAPPGLESSFENADLNRNAYLDYFKSRTAEGRPYLDEAIKAQETLARSSNEKLPYRR